MDDTTGMDDAADMLSIFILDFLRVRFAAAVPQRALPPPSRAGHPLCTAQRRVQGPFARVAECERGLADADGTETIVRQHSGGLLPRGAHRGAARYGEG
jgi:hypothetical protein